MQTAVDLRGKRADLIEQARKLVDKAESASRDLNTGEAGEYKRLLADARHIEERYKRMEDLSGLEADLAKPIREVGPDPLGDEPAPSRDGGLSTRNQSPHVGERWADASGVEIKVYQPDERLSERSDCSVGKLCCAALRGDWSGAKIEKRAVSGSEDAAGGFTLNEQMTREILDSVRARSVVFAKTRIVEMNTSTMKVARVDEDPSSGWTAENVTRSDDSPTFGSLNFTARTLRCWIPASEEWLADSVGAIEAIERAITGSFATALDLAILAGGATGDAMQPQGLRTIPDVNEQGTVGVPVFADFSTAWQTALTNNAVGQLHCVAHPRTYGSLDRTVTGISSDTSPVQPPGSWAQLQKLMSTVISVSEGSSESYAVVGPLGDCIVGMRLRTTIGIVRDADSGKKYQRSLVGAMRCDFGCPHPEFFTKLTGITVT